MTPDDVLRTWWVFRLPAAVCYVPAKTEAEAVAALVRDSYTGAPVHEWPLIGAVYRSRVDVRRPIGEP